MDSKLFLSRDSLLHIVAYLWVDDLDALSATSQHLHAALRRYAAYDTLWQPKWGQVPCGWSKRESVFAIQALWQRKPKETSVGTQMTAESQSTVYCACVRNDGTLLCGCTDGSILSLTNMTVPIVKYKGHTGSVRHMIDLDSHNFMSCSWDGTLRVWPSGNVLVRCKCEFVVCLNHECHGNTLLPIQRVAS